MVRSLSSATYCDWSATVEHDDAAYVDPKLKSSPLGRDCLNVSEEFMIQKGWASGEQITRWRAEARVKSMSPPRSAARTIARSERGRLEGNLKPLRDTGRGMITYLEAIRSGLAKVLADDPRVFVWSGHWLFRRRLQGH